MTISHLADWAADAPLRTISARNFGRSGFVVTLTQLGADQEEDINVRGFGPSLESAARDALAAWGEAS